MAINFLNTIDFNKNQLNNLVVQSIPGADPGAGALGQLIFSVTGGTIKVCTTAAVATGAVWSEVGGGVISVAASIAGTAYTATVADPNNAASISIAANGSAAQYINGAGNLITFPSIPQGDITAVVAGTYLGGGGTSGSVTLNHDTTTRTDTASASSPAHGATFTAVDSISSNATGHVTAINLKTVTLPADNNDNTTYTFNAIGSGSNYVDLNLVGANPYSLDSVRFAGTTNQITLIENPQEAIIIGLPDEVTISDRLYVTNEGNFGGQVRIPVTPQFTDSATSKSYVDASNVGQSIFQGGYNASTNTPNLDVAPSSSIKKGWFWAVTDTGNFFSEEVQPGDLIYANQDNPGATYANWTVVQSGQDIAGQGSSDGATTKGVAGFNSAHFNVTSNGWVSSDIYAGGSSLGIVPAGGNNVKYLRGDGTWVTPTDNNTQRAAGIGLTLSGNTINANVDGTQSAAANSSSTTSGKTYKVQVDSSDNLVVNVPWVNTSNVTSVAESTVNNRLGIKVTPTTGAPKVGLAINTLTAITALADTDAIPVYDASAATNKKITLLQLENHIGAAKSKRFILNTTTTNVAQQSSPPGGTIGWTINAGAALGVSSALDCTVEVIQTSTGETVYASTTRTGTSVTINFTGTVAQGAYQALVTRIY